MVQGQEGSCLEGDPSEGSGRRHGTRMILANHFLDACKEAKASKLNCISHVMVLVHLSTKDDGDYPSRLAEMAGVSTAAITGTLDVLEKLNLIERGRCKSDRRGNRAYILPAGLEAIARMLP